MTLEINFKIRINKEKYQNFFRNKMYCCFSKIKDIRDLEFLITKRCEIDKVLKNLSQAAKIKYLNNDEKVFSVETYRKDLENIYQNFLQIQCLIETFEDDQIKKVVNIESLKEELVEKETLLKYINGGQQNNEYNLKANYEEKIKILVRNLENSQDELKKNEEDIQKLKQEKEALEYKNSNLIVNYQMETETFNKQMNLRDITLKNLKTELIQNINDSNKKNHLLEKQMEDLTLETTNLKSFNDTINEKLLELSQTDEKLKKLSEKHKLLKLKYKDFISRNDKNENIISSLRNQLKAFELTKDELLSKIKTQEKKYQDLEAQNNLLQKQINLQENKKSSISKFHPYDIIINIDSLKATNNGWKIENSTKKSKYL